MLLPEPWPIEGVFGAIVLCSGLIGLFLMGVEAMTRVSGVYPVAGFFYVLTRAGFVALLSVLLWGQIEKLQSHDDWPGLTFRVFTILLFAVFIVENLVVLLGRVATDRYGRSSTIQSPT